MFEFGNRDVDIWSLGGKRVRNSSSSSTKTTGFSLEKYKQFHQKYAPGQPKTPSQNLFDNFKTEPGFFSFALFQLLPDMFVFTEPHII